MVRRGEKVRRGGELMYLSDLEIENIARDVFDAYRELPEISDPGRMLRVDPLLLCRGVLFLKFRFERLSDDGSLLGLTAYEPCFAKVYDDAGSPMLFALDGRTLLIEKELDKQRSLRGRRNFTVMHEAAHLLLGRLYPGRYNAGGSRMPAYRGAPSSARYSPEEYQADRLAAAMLMPEKLVRRNMYLAGLPPVVALLDRVVCPDVYRRFLEVAAMMECSASALALRMQRLGLVEVNDCGAPLRCLDAEVM